MRVYAPAGHRLRYELEESWARDPIPGSELGVKNVLQTQADMQNAVFCVCPPGVLPSGARAVADMLLTQTNMLSWLATKSAGLQLSFAGSARGLSSLAQHVVSYDQVIDKKKSC